MPTTVSDLKKAVAAYMNRDEADFVRDTRDNLLSACNNARLYVERTVDLEMARVSAQLSVSLANGSNISGTVLYGTTTLVRVKTIKAAGLQLVGSSNIVVPIRIYNRDDYLSKIKRRFANASSLNESELNSGEIPIGIMRMGNLVFLAPNGLPWFPAGTSSATVYMDIFKWLPTYTAAGTESDFLLDYCFDYMLYRTVAELQLFTKEDNRVILQAKVVQQAWESLTAWNAAIVQQSDDVSLS